MHPMKIFLVVTEPVKISVAKHVHVVGLEGEIVVFYNFYCIS
jgi:hypothetical protein